MPKLTRRAAIAATAAAPAALSLAGPARAAGHSAGGLAMAKARGFQIGDFEVTTILAGSFQREDPRSTFAANVPEEDFAAISADNFLPTDSVTMHFTPTVVKTGSETILFDTGLNAASTTAALADAGVAPEDVTHVVITHMHGDHIGGMTTEDGSLTYANAAYLTGQAEYDAWAAMDNETFDAKVRPFGDQMTFLGDGDSVASGVTAVAAFGHTPGHMNYMIESGGRQVLLVADLVAHYVYSFIDPTWELRFDRDKEAASATRKRTLSMLATDKIPMIGYHMPFPSAGFVETRGEGFRFVPVSYQLM